MVMDMYKQLSTKDGANKSLNTGFTPTRNTHRGVVKLNFDKLIGLGLEIGAQVHVAPLLGISILGKLLEPLGVRMSFA